MRLLTGILEFNDFPSRLAKDLLFVSISFILMSKSSEVLTCELLVVPKRGVNISAKDLQVL